MNGRLSRVFYTVAAVLALALVVLEFWPANVVIEMPAAAEAIDAHIHIAGHPLRPGWGKLYITFVSEPQPTVLMQIVQSLNPDASVLTSQEVFGTAQLPAQSVVEHQNILMMRQSKDDAQVAAFRALGYHVPGLRTVVVEIGRQSRARGLQAGDIIVQVNGASITTNISLVAHVRPLRPGSTIHLLVERLGVRRPIRLAFPTIAYGGYTAIGIAAQTIYTAPSSALPFHVTIDSGDVQGPSAGLMFALAISNRLSASDLTHGYKIAGTGEIDADGVVGPIGGVKQKVIGARESGARLFFVPRFLNYAEAKRYASGITLVPVSTLSEAIAYLRHLR